jgi:hypothetical protein
MKSSIFWDITPCSPFKVNRRFGRTFRLYLQRRRISQTRNQRETGNKPITRFGGISSVIPKKCGNDELKLETLSWLLDRMGSGLREERGRDGNRPVCYAFLGSLKMRAAESTLVRSYLNTKYRADSQQILRNLAKFRYLGGAATKQYFIPKKLRID